MCIRDRGGLDEIKICIGYELDGEVIGVMPTSCDDLARCIPVYETHPGFPALSDDEWIAMADGSRSSGSGLASMPEAVLRYVRRIEELSGIPVVSVGVGPDRRASIASSGGPFDVDSVEATF